MNSGRILRALDTDISLEIIILTLNSLNTVTLNMCVVSDGDDDDDGMDAKNWSGYSSLMVVRVVSKPYHSLPVAMSSVYLF